MIEVEIYTATPDGLDWDARGVFLLNAEGQVEAHPADGAAALFEEMQEDEIPIGDKVYNSGDNPKEWLESLPIQYRGTALVAIRIDDERN